MKNNKELIVKTDAKNNTENDAVNAITSIEKGELGFKQQLIM